MPTSVGAYSTVWRFNPHWGSSNTQYPVYCSPELAVSIPIGVLRIRCLRDYADSFLGFNPHWGSSNLRYLRLSSVAPPVSIPIGVLRMIAKNAVKASTGLFQSPLGFFESWAPTPKNLTISCFNPHWGSSNRRYGDKRTPHATFQSPLGFFE